MTKNNKSGSRGGFLKGNAELLGYAIRVFDLLIIILAGFIAHYVRLNTFELNEVYKLFLLVVVFGSAVIFPLFELYKPWRGMSIWLEIRELILAWMSVVALALAFAYFSKTGAEYSRLWIGYWILISISLLVGGRMAIRLMLRWARRQGYNTRNILIVGAGKLGRRVCGNLRTSGWVGMNVVGFVDDNIELADTRVEKVPVIGKIDELESLLKVNRKQPIDQVWLALPLTAEDKIREVCKALENSTVSIIFVPDIFMHSLLNQSVDDLAGMPVVNLRASPIEGGGLILKYLIDVLVSSLAIILTLPLMALIAITIKLESPGPVLFKQRRYGIDGREIVIWKFRTMKVLEDGGSVPQAVKDDPRKTKFGALLRKTSMDEFPQFFNVLQGRMSVVGPRPHAVAHNEQYREIVDKYMWRHKVKPGITGWAQVNGWRGETDTPEKMEKRVEYDLEYIENWSIWLDIRIIIVTLFTGFRSKNAY